MAFKQIKKLEELFVKGKYDECLKIINSLLRDTRSRCDKQDATKAAESNDISDDLAPEMLEIVLEGNEILLNGMILFKSSKNDSKQQWNTLCHSFTKYYTKVKALNPLKHPPDVTYLNTVFSILWLETMKQNRNHSSFDKMFIIQILVDCFKRVILFSGEWPCHSSGGTEEVLLLLAQTTTCLLNLESVNCLLMVEICLLCSNLLLEFSVASPQLIKDVVSKLNEMWPLIQVKVKKAEIITNNDKSIKMLKFGLFKINETAENWNLQETSEFVSVMSSMCLLRLGCTAESLNYIEDGNDISHQFLCVYLKAFCYYHLREKDSCLLNLSYASQKAKTIAAQVHVRMLKGEMLSSLGEYSAAHDEYMSALQANQYCHRLLYHILNNLKRSLRTVFEQREGSGTKYILKHALRALCYIYKFLKNLDYAESKEDCNLETKVLCYLNNNNNVQREDILYLIGEELLWIMQVDGVSLHTNPSPSTIAAECFLDIFESRSCGEYSKNSASLLPSDHILLQETAIALLLAGQVDAAETVCNVVINYSEKGMECKTEEKEEEWFLKRNICAMMLMACIKMVRNQREEAAAHLRRCKNIIIHCYFNSSPSRKGLKSPLFDLVASRVHLLTALLQWRNCCFLDARRSLHRAVVHNPGDAVILKHCASFEKETGMEVVMPEVSKSSANNFSTLKEYKTVALHYLLTAQLPL